MNYIIGAGGVGSWLAPALVKLLNGGKDITLIDGDTLERKNLDRQLFDMSDIGKNKAATLAKKYKTAAVADWFSSVTLRPEPDDVLIVCVDNHAARNDALTACDASGCVAIFAANETHSAEAYYYNPEWMKDTPLDPRKFYPEITTDKSNDPRAAAIGCTGEAQVNNPQLATANFMAASLALHLYVLWIMEARKLNKETLPFLPHKLSSTLTRLESTPCNQTKPQ